MSEIYHGSSDGFDEVVGGYEDYAKAIIASRTIPDIRDGLKKVQRRILYKCWQTRTGNLQKCSTLVGSVMSIHPHGDGSIYSAMCLLSDENGSFLVPYFHGNGNLGKVFTSKSPAAMRYPKAMINENGLDFFKDADIMEMVPSEEGEGEEPVVLMAPYPSVLVNGAEGIAVGTGTKMPSFNFGDVIDLTCKYIQEGSLTTEDIIRPDFATGGILVSDDSELLKIMLTGKGKLKIRAKVEIMGKVIRVVEVPYGKTVQSIIHAVNSAEIRDIVNATSAVGRDSSYLVNITCKNKRCVESVLMELYRKNILQSTFASSILVVDNSEPLILGVHDIIARWYQWRVSCLLKKFSNVVESTEKRCGFFSYFLRLCDNTEWRDTYISYMVNKSSKEGDAYLREIMPDIPEDIVKWIRDRSLSAFNKSGRYQKEYAELQETIAQYKGYMEHPETYVLQELQSLKASKNGQYERRTEITYKDYKFSKVSDSVEVEDDSSCVYTLFKNGFLVKSRGSLEADEKKKGVFCEIHAQANSVLVGFDDYGRVLRVIGKEIPFTPYGDNGVYLPTYFGVEDAESKDYHVLYLTVIDGSVKTLVYRDGYIGFFDTSEFLGKKNTKIISKGICERVSDKLLHVYDDCSNMLLMVADNSDKLKIGIVDMDTVLVKSRMSRTKVFSAMGIDTPYLSRFSQESLSEVLPGYEGYVGKYKVLKDDLTGNLKLDDGIYLGTCVNYEDMKIG